jgi:hypothetical protein
MENKFLKLTNAVYKLLEFFPEADPLKNRAKDRALAIMSALGGSASGRENLLEDIDVLLGYLWIGKSQGWLSPSNCLIICNEYEKIKKELGPAIETPVFNKDKKEAEIKISARQGKILEFLGRNEKAQVMNLQIVLPNVTKRTIRRDLDELLEIGRIERMGEFNQVFYKIKK